MKAFAYEQGGESRRFEIMVTEDALFNLKGSKVMGAAEMVRTVLDEKEAIEVQVGEKLEHRLRLKYPVDDNSLVIISELG